MVCVAAAFPELRSWDSLKLDLPNTPLQSLQLQFSLAYLIADTGYMLAFTPTDYLFLAHHALAGLYLYAVLALRRGAISALLIFFLGEVTSPLLNAFTVSKELKEEKSWAARMFAVASPMFTGKWAPGGGGASQAVTSCASSL